MIKQLFTDLYDSLQNEEYRKRVALVLLRYSAQFLGGVLVTHHILTEDQSKHLGDLFLDPVVVAIVAALTLVLATALKTLFAMSKETLTAASANKSMTVQEVKEATKQVAPSLSASTPDPVSADQPKKE